MERFRKLILSRTNSERVKLERQILSAKKKIAKLEEEAAGTQVEDTDEGTKTETEESEVSFFGLTLLMISLSNEMWLMDC